MNKKQKTEERIALAGFILGLVLFLLIALAGKSSAQQVPEFMYWCNGNGSVSFQDSSSGSPNAWIWDFGDGSGDTTQNPTHQFQTYPDSFAVTLYVSWDGGVTYTSVIHVIYLDSLGNCLGGGGSNLPIAAFNYGCGGSGVVQFYELSSYETSWLWNFGDGTTSTLSNLLHNFSIYPATYFVQLTVCNSLGCDSVGKLIMLDSLGSCVNAPVAAFYYWCVYDSSGISVYFNDYSGANPTSWQWDFGDGSSVSNVQNPIHSYTNVSANYAVTLVVSNTYGSDTTVQTISLNQWGCDSTWYYYNTISGTIYNDANYNCMRDSGESGIPYQLVEVTPGPYYGWSDYNGNYSVYVYSAGNYTVTQYPYSPWGQNCPTSPATYSVTFSSLGNNSYGNDFADTTGTPCADLAVYLGTWGIRPCFVNYHYIDYYNAGSMTVTGATVTVTFDSNIKPIISWPMWDSQVGNTYTWNVSTLNPYDWGWIWIEDSLDCSAMLGDILCSNAEISPVSGDCNPADNMTVDCETVVNSYDPNDKSAASRDFSANGYVTTEQIRNDDALTYKINFQNTGTASAVNVVLRDTLDTNLLDVTTLQLLSSSHPVSRFQILGNGILEWTFANINLPDSGTNEPASHGFVTFKIQQKPGNTDGTQIKNGAAIVFDNNPAVITNKTVHTINNSLGIDDMVASSNFSVVVYPNPFATSATMRITNNEQGMKNYEIKLYDFFGREMKSEIVRNSDTFVIRRGNLPGGMYFYQLRNAGKIIATGKVVVQ